MLPLIFKFYFNKTKNKIKTDEAFTTTEIPLKGDFLVVIGSKKLFGLLTIAEMTTVITDSEDRSAVSVELLKKALEKEEMQREENKADTSELNDLDVVVVDLCNQL